MSCLFLQIRQRLHGGRAKQTPAEVAAHWDEYESQGHRRGNDIADRLRPFTEFEGRRALDVGCGNGAISLVLAQLGCEVIGADLNYTAVSNAAKRPEGGPGLAADFLRGVSESLPFPSGSFDLIVCNDVLEHVSSHKRTLRELARVVKPGGLIYCKFPNLLSLTNLMKDPHYGVFGASILPPKLGAWYVVKLLGCARSYAVGRFPVASEIIWLLHESQVEIIGWWPAPKRDIGFLTPLLRWYRLNTYGEITLVAQKRAVND